MLCTFRQAQDLPGPATFHLLLFFAPVRRLFGAAGRGAPRQALLHGLPHGPGQAWLCLAVWGLQGRRRTGSYPHPVRFVVLNSRAVCSLTLFELFLYTHSCQAPQLPTVRLVNTYRRVFPGLKLCVHCLHTARLCQQRSATVLLKGCFSSMPGGQGRELGLAARGYTC